MPNSLVDLYGTLTLGGNYARASRSSRSDGPNHGADVSPPRRSTRTQGAFPVARTAVLLGLLVLIPMSLNRGMVVQPQVPATAAPLSPQADPG